MRRILALLVVAVLVNLPWAHEAWVGLRLASSGRDVKAVVVGHDSVAGRQFVRFRLPADVDPQRTTYAARIDSAHYRVAVASGRIAVRVVPGHPSENRPAGEVSSAILGVVALVGDGVLALLLAAIWLRRRRWAVRQVELVDGDLVTFTMAGATFTARVDPGLLGGLVAGGRVGGRLSLRADSDVLPAGPVGEVERLGGARYRVRGRVADVDRRHTDLRLERGMVLRVVAGGHRNRADLREPAEVTGELVLTRELD
ncbi:hypothetical protein [Nocardioides terrisoli]|uniref:hypothetical protein n=1 Tax=Nocardioides terrisoli TaxID=3388267 RepID=UPI00287BAF33|nr:hypothetical protein [Nocardioides marmorisolisilvae]